MRRAVSLATLVALAGLLAFLWSVWDHEWVTAWMRHARPVPFFAAAALLPAFGAPFTPFFVLAGATFGNRVGLVGSGLALGLNLTLCYAIARSGLRPRLISLLGRFHYELPDFGKAGRDAVRFTLLVKLAPGIPGFIKNYGLGVAGVPFGLYFVSSMLITGLYAVVLVVLGDAMLEHNLGRASLVGAIVVVAVGLWWVYRRQAPASIGTTKCREKLW